MLLYGQFRNINDELITVEILTNGDTSTTREINRTNGLWFSDEPLVIERSPEESFEHIIKTSCEINLVTRDYQGTELFADNSRSVEVTVSKGNEVIFFGFLEPNTYSQPFAKPLENITLNCVDCLSTLEYYNYNDATFDNFNTKRQTATNVSFRTILDKIFTNDITKGKILYDLSKCKNNNRYAQVFDDLGIAELYLYGEEFDDVWTYEEVLEEMLRYLNLHIMQIGYDFIIYDLDAIRDQNTSYIDLVDNQTYTLTSSLINLNGAIHAADDTNITVDEVYNQIQVECKLEEQELVIESPLDSDNLSSVYNGKQLYMTEYISEGSGDDAHDALVAMVNGNPTTFGGAHEIEWFVQAMQNKNWKFYYNGTTDVDDYLEYNNKRYINQWKMPKFVFEHPLTPYIFKFGSVDRQSKATDNSPISKVEMKPYLFVSVNGNEIDEETYQMPNDAAIESAQTMIEYVGNNSGGVFSPVDDETTNYIVFSGKLCLQPIVYESSSNVSTRTNNYEDIKQNGLRKTEGVHARVPNYDYHSHSYLPFGGNNLVRSDNNDEGRYYTRKFYTTVNPSDKPNSYQTDTSGGLQPLTKDKSAHGYEFEYSQHWDGSDLYSKLPILECELIIGNKRLIETNMDIYGNSTFQWVTIGQEPTTTYNGVTYPITTFSLGVNPKIGDYIIGDEFDIQNTIDYTMNLDCEGTAIPIKKSDNLSGAVIFRILGPVNTIWNEISRRHPSFWRHTSWSDNWRFLLSHTQNIILSDFECKIVTDNGLNELDNDKDLIYMSDETDRFINKKDDITFKFITQLSSAEAAAKGISAASNLNAVIDMSTSSPLSSIYNRTTQETAKAEEHYVDSYYREYSEPKIKMETTLHNNNINYKNIYHSTVLNRDFYIVGETYDVRMDNKTITMKEV